MIQKRFLINRVAFFIWSARDSGNVHTVYAFDRHTVGWGCVCNYNKGRCCMLPICDGCALECETPCKAVDELYNIYNQIRTEQKTEIIKKLRSLLNVQDYEVADDLRELGERVIDAMPELNIIRDCDIKVAYVRSYEPKRDKGRTINADCRKVNSSYSAFLPYDFIVTVYEPNMYYMTQNQIKVLMLHELKHIGIGVKGLKIENHDIEDFKDILIRYGLDWNGLDQDVQDITIVGGEDETKGNKMETKPKTDRNSKSPAKS